MDSEYLTTGEAARLLNIDPATVRQLIAKGRIPARRFGRDWQITPSDLRTYADSRRKTASKPGPRSRREQS